MTWANVDDLFPEHPKVLAAGGDAGWLYICGLCFTNRNLTEGRIPKAVVPRLSDRKAPMRLAKVLIEVGLWHDGGDHFVIHDWEKYNENAEAIKARKEHARNAARARWGGLPKPPSGNAQSMLGALPGASDEHQSSTMLNPNRAMPSHSSPEIPPPQSSSKPPAKPPAGAEEEVFQDRKTQAARLVAQRRLATRNGEPITNRPGWLRKVTREVLAEHGPTLGDLAMQGLNASAMAEAIEPSTAPSPYPEAGEQREPVWDEQTDEHGRLVAVPRAAG